MINWNAQGAIFLVIFHSVNGHAIICYACDGFRSKAQKNQRAIDQSERNMPYRFNRRTWMKEERNLVQYQKGHAHTKK